MKSNYFHPRSTRSIPHLLASAAGFLLLMNNAPLFAQNLQWGYSFTNSQVLESITDLSSNQTNRFAIIGTGNQGISMDPINKASSYASPGNFLATYDENANIQWLHPTVGNAFGVQVASDGSVFVAGNFAGSQDFDPAQATSSILNASAYDSYLQKFNPDGSFAWAVGAAAEGTPSKIENLPDGRIIVAGRSDVDATVTLSNNSTVSLSKGLYMLEVSPSGSLLNAYSISVPGATAYMYVYDIHSDDSGNIFLGGTLDGVADFDLGAGISNNPMTNGYDAYIVKYSPSFDLEWFRTFGDTNTPMGWDKTRGIGCDTDGNVYVTGEFTWTTDFAPSSPGNFILTSATNSQVPSGFLLKLSPEGLVNWVRKMGNSNDGVATNYASVAGAGIVIQDNSLITALEGEGYWDVDPSANTFILPVGAIASPGIGFAQYTLSGDFIDAFSIDTALTGTGVSMVGISLLHANSFVVSGRFTKLMDFDPTGDSHLLEIDPNGPFTSFDNDLYIAKYSFDNSVNLENVRVTKPLQLYPNPANDQVQIQTPDGLKISRVMVHDAAGKLIAEAGSDTRFLQTAQWPSGIYFVQSYFSDGSMSKAKLIR